jgi:hypothetical protein
VRSLAVEQIILAFMVLLLLAPNVEAVETATPSAREASNFADLLHLMPSIPLGPGSLAYSDSERQLATFGFIGRPTSQDIDQLRAALGGMAFMMAGDISA